MLIPKRARNGTSERKSHFPATIRGDSVGRHEKFENLVHHQLITPAIPYYTYSYMGSRSFAR